ncbi:MAG: hypothetical protein WC055_16620 [Melioribacteraceae bacterium]
MEECCELCAYCECTDLSDVSGFKCAINPTYIVDEPEKRHPMCREFKFSLLKFLFGV